MRIDDSVENYFTTVEDLKNIWQMTHQKVVVWGTNKFAEQVFYTLTANGISVMYFGDNDHTRWKGQYCGRRVISPKGLLQLSKPILVIASYWYKDIYSQFFELGIHDIYILKECYKYAFQEMISDRMILRQYFDNYDTKISDKILIEMYGNFGDIVVANDIIQCLINSFGKEKVFFIVEDIWNDANADFVRLHTDNVFSINNARFISDRDYRIHFLRQLNKQYFKTTVSISFMIAHARRRYLNQYNFNVKTVYLNHRTEGYVPDLYIDFLKELFAINYNQALSANNSLNSKIPKPQHDIVLPDKYVAIGMGASDSVRIFDVNKMASVVEHILNSGFYVVLLGLGEADEKYNNKLLQLLENNSRIINYTSNFSIVESMYIIQKSKLFLGTESGMWNASYALGKNSVVLYGGGDYGNFLHKADYIHYVIVSHRRCFGCRWNCINKKENGTAHCIDDITPNMIIEKIDTVFKCLV